MHNGKSPNVISWRARRRYICMCFRNASHWNDIAGMWRSTVLVRLRNYYLHGRNIYPRCSKISIRRKTYQEDPPSLFAYNYMDSHTWDWCLSTVPRQQYNSICTLRDLGSLVRKEFTYILLLDYVSEFPVSVTDLQIHTWLEIRRLKLNQGFPEAYVFLVLCIWLN